MSAVSALDYPAVDGRVVTQGHADYCATHGHAKYVKDGVPQGMCPRCGARKWATKWDLSSTRDRVALDATRFGAPCSGCGLGLATEGDFARHFVLGDVRFLNLGWCPVKEES